jgi:hypothetical protein
MHAPKCPVCGKVEWRHLCSGTAQSEIGRRFEKARVTKSRNKLPDFVTKERNAPVTRDAAVTREVPRSEPASRVRALEKTIKAQATELEAQAGEIAQLKRMLAEARGGTPKPVPVPAAERMRKMRAKKKTGVQQFEG